MRYNENLIDDLMKTAGFETSHSSKSDPKTELLKQSSTLLKVAAEEIRKKDSEIARLAIKNKAFQEKEENDRRDKKISSIVESMFEKGMLKQTDLEDKKNELKALDSATLEAIEKTVSEIPEKKAEFGYSELTFLSGNNNIKDKKTLDGALNGFVNKIF